MEARTINRLDESLLGNRIKVSPHRLHINYRVKKAPLQRRNQVDSTLSYWSKSNHQTKMLYTWNQYKIILNINCNWKTKLKKKIQISPGWCGSVYRVLACKPKGHRFDSQSGHLPGLWARCPVGGVRGTHKLMFLSLSFSLSSPLSKNK